MVKEGGYHHHRAAPGILICRFRSRCYPIWILSLSSRISEKSDDLGGESRIPKALTGLCIRATRWIVPAPFLVFFRVPVLARWMRSEERRVGKECRCRG